jgi:hypothetical protein
MQANLTVFANHCVLPTTAAFLMEAAISLPRYAGCDSNPRIAAILVQMRAQPPQKLHSGVPKFNLRLA